MSIDTTFRPLTKTYLMTTGAAINLPEAQSLGVVTFRLRNTAATTAYVTYGVSSAVTAAGAPAAGTPVANTIGVTAGAVIYLDLPSTTWFASSVATSFEITGGQGGVGG